MKTITIRNVLLVFIALFFSGCLTKNLFQETVHYKHYEDKIIYYKIGSGDNYNHAIKQRT